MVSKLPKFSLSEAFFHVAKGARYCVDVLSGTALLKKHGVFDPNSDGKGISATLAFVGSVGCMPIVLFNAPSFAVGFSLYVAGVTAITLAAQWPYTLYTVGAKINAERSAVNKEQEVAHAQGPKLSSIKREIPTAS